MLSDEPTTRCGLTEEALRQELSHSFLDDSTEMLDGMGSERGILPEDGRRSTSVGLPGSHPSKKKTLLCICMYLSLDKA